MRYAICNEIFGDWPLAKACAYAAECGYGGIEIAPFTLAPLATDLSSKVRAEIRRTIARAGLECVGLHWLLAKTTGLHAVDPDPNVRQRTLAYLGELARLCHDLGGRVLVFGSPQQRSLLPGVSPEAAIDHLAELFLRLLPVLETSDTVLAIEPLSATETDVLTTTAETIRLVERINSPHVRLHLDAKALASESVPACDSIRTSACHLEHFHANDINLQGPGFGALDFTPIFSALSEIHYSGWVSVEVFDYAPGPERLALESIRYLQRIESEAG